MLRTRSDPQLLLPDGTRLAIELRPHARARKWSLRYDMGADRVRLVMPKRGSRRAALAWAEKQAEWVAGQRAKAAARVPLVPGYRIAFRGMERLIVHDPNSGRRVRIEDDRLIVGGPEDAVTGRLARWLREESRALLEEESRDAAQRAGVEIRRVSVGDARTRWGSCSSEGSIRYSWRLILMPDEVRRYVVAHEVAHRLHMDHGPQFHALEARLFDGDVGRARRLLRLWSERVRLVG